jgi:pyridoxal phosphate enzyme (YggS family)
MDYAFVADRVASVRERIEAAARRSGRDPGTVELLAVTKLHPIEAVAAAWDAGLRAFGESRVQEAEAKYGDFLAGRPSARLDMIGGLQTNKVKKAVLLFSRIQSADSLDLVLAIDSRARAAERRVEVLLELHTGEESKAGFRGLDELYRALDEVYSSPDRRVEPRGLMTMAPNVADRGPVRASFVALREALEGARSRFGPRSLDVLSMGMSGDFETAVEEGSTSVRLGTVLFGTPLGEAAR